MMNNRSTYCLIAFKRKFESTSVHGSKQPHRQEQCLPQQPHEWHVTASSTRSFFSFISASVPLHVDHSHRQLTSPTALAFFTIIIRSSIFDLTANLINPCFQCSCFSALYDCCIIFTNRNTFRSSEVCQLDAFQFNAKIFGDKFATR